MLDPTLFNTIALTFYVEMFQYFLKIGFQHFLLLFLPKTTRTGALDNLLKEGDKGIGVAAVY
jgi:hypothetical protein